MIDSTADTMIRLQTEETERNTPDQTSEQASNHQETREANSIPFSPSADFTAREGTTTRPISHDTPIMTPSSTATISFQDNRFSRWFSKLLQKTVLQPRFPLRRQMFLSFGTTALLAICFFILIGIVTAILSGQTLLKEANQVQDDLARHTLTTSARYVAETITQQMRNFQTTSDLVRQVTRDRIVGYKSVAFLREVEQVPFIDYNTGRNMYPIQTPHLLQLDWNTTQTPQDILNLQDRKDWFDPELQTSTAYASYFMQGTCDPSAGMHDPGYYPGCTDDNNNVQTGGMVSPSPDNSVLFRRGADTIFALKALWESHDHIKALGVYFFNGGAGSYIKFPAHKRDGRHNVTLQSCDWMTSTINARTHRFLGTTEEVERCRNPLGAMVNFSENDPTVVPGREYNPMRRSWCIRQAQALNEDRAVTTGPYLDASSNNNTPSLWIMTIGHGIFDQLTGEFIGCTLVDISLDSFGDSLNGVALGETSTVALVRWDENDDEAAAGMVVACGRCQINPQRTEPYHITDLPNDFGVDDHLFQEIKQLVDFRGTQWDPDQVKRMYNETIFHRNGRLLMMYPVPYIPSQYDPYYEPEFMVVMSFSEDEIFGYSRAMEDTIQQDVRQVVRDISLIGLAGLIVIFSFLAWISLTLTKPLTWMQETTAKVVQNAGEMADDDVINDAEALAPCSPRTEVTVLLSEFEMMMDGFSGKGAAEVADTRIVEVENRFQWRDEYKVLYPFEFRRSDQTGNKLENVEGSSEEHSPSEDMLSVNTQRTMLSALTESSLVQSIILQPYEGVKKSLSKAVSNFATASYSAGMDKLPTWAQSMLAPTGGGDDDMPNYIVSPPKVHLGPNVKRIGAGVDSTLNKRPIEVSSSSRVFLLVTLTIGIPIILTATAIVSSGELWIRHNIDKWLEDVKAASYAIEQDALVTATLARSAFGSEVMGRFLRDLHFLSRTAGWLLFGGLQRTSSFTRMRTGTEECKMYDPETFDCPYKTLEVTCDCGWHDFWAAEEQCVDYSSKDINSRFLQTIAFAGLKTDIDPLTGNRIASSFPNVSRTPEETSWWENQGELPGAFKGPQASGFETANDRLRVLSAMSAVHFPLFHYFPEVDSIVPIGSWVGLEADGMLLGYSGCDVSPADYAFFQSNEDNRASEVAPELCPLGQYGYDCRCRDWYASAKEGGVYISPPCAFAGSNRMGSSAAYALKDPKDSTAIAVALLDFVPDAFMRALGPQNTFIGQGNVGFAIVITPKEDIFGGNTIVGPDYDFGTDGPMSILDVTLPEDSERTLNREQFDGIVASMGNGEAGNATFIRLNNGKEESVFLSFAPVYVRVLEPMNHSDFAAGCNSTSQLVYSLGIAIAETDLYLRYNQVEQTVDSQLRITRGVSIAAILVIAISFTVFTYYISLNITRPIIALTRIVKGIKNKSLRDEIPDVEGGSLEVIFVHESFQRLMKVVRFANTAFFAGDRTQSHRSMEEALTLFLKLGNQKAIGVASNNLGTMVLQEQMEAHGTDRLFDNSLFGICISEIYHVGISFFDEALHHGSFEYELSVGTDDQVSYAKQLANRHFNRGMFLVVVRNHPLCPSWVYDDGVRDILRSKDLDLENLQLLHKHGVYHEHELQQFESLLRRTRGILLLMRNYGFKDPWGVESLIDQAETLLNEACDDTSNLFHGMTREGRRQQLDDLKIQHALCQKHSEAAAKLAIRMLVEDEFIIDTTIVNALSAVDQYFREEKILIPRINTTQYLQRETRRAQVNVLREAKNVFFCLDYSGSMAGERMKCANKNLLWIYHEHCSDKDMVGFIRFNHGIDESLWFPLGKKGDWKEVQEAVLAIATDAVGGTRLYSALDRCVTHIFNTETKNDTWIVALTDGESNWDHSAKKVAERIRKANKHRERKLHVVLIGFEVPSSAIKDCLTVCSVSDKSLYIDARGDLEEMDKAFEQVVSVIGGNFTTMETF